MDGMSAPMELTQAERDAGVEAIRASSKEGYGYGFGTVLDEVVKAINKVRLGDPAGTIRMNSNGDIAVRCHYRNDPQHLAWRVYTHHYLGLDQRKGPGISTEEWIGPAGDCGWPVIYSPDGA